MKDYEKRHHLLDDRYIIMTDDEGYVLSICELCGTDHKSCFDYILNRPCVMLDKDGKEIKGNIKLSNLRTYYTQGKIRIEVI